MDKANHILSVPWGDTVVIDDPEFADPDHEYDNLKFLDEILPNHDGSIFVDAGAHQGFYTSFLARKAGPKGMVYAFEPLPGNFKLLIQNTIFHANRAPVIIHPLALGARAATGALNCWWSERPLSTGMSGLKIGEAPDYIVPTAVRTLDSFNLPHVDFIKIDVEHWEFDLIQGGKETILRDRPIMMIELHNEEVEKSICAFCDEHGMRWETRQAKGCFSYNCKYLFINVPPQRTLANAILTGGKP